MSDNIDTAEVRLDLAKETNSEFRGMVSSFIAGYVVVDDGMDRWISTEEDFDLAMEGVVEDVLDGSLVPDPDEGYQPAYDRLCAASYALYSRIGSPNSIDDLIESLKCDHSDMLEIFEALGIEDSLPLVD